jgi:hypothetical protein
MRSDYDGSPITDEGPRCRHCDRDAGPDGLCNRHTGPPERGNRGLKLWHIVELGGAELEMGSWFVVAPDRGIAREVLLEHEVPPEHSLVFAEIDLDSPVGIIITTADGALVAPSTAVEEKLEAGRVRYVAQGREWIERFSVPGVLACSEW